jgi:hypothetical protein
MYGMDMSSSNQGYGQQQQSAGSAEEQLLQMLMQMKQQGFTDVQMVEELIGMGIPDDQAPAIVSSFATQMQNQQRRQQAAGMQQQQNMMMAWGGGIPRADLGMEVPMFGTGTLETLPNVENYTDYNSFRQDYSNYLNNIETTTTIAPLSEEELLDNIVSKPDTIPGAGNDTINSIIKKVGQMYVDPRKDTLKIPMPNQTTSTNLGIPSDKDLSDKEKEQINSSSSGIPPWWAIGATAVTSPLAIWAGKKTYNWAKKPIQTRFGTVKEIDRSILTESELADFKKSQTAYMNEILSRGYKRDNFDINNLVSRGATVEEAKEMIKNIPTKERWEQINKTRGTRSTAPTTETTPASTETTPTSTPTSTPTETVVTETPKRKTRQQIILENSQDYLSDLNSEKETERLHTREVLEDKAFNFEGEKQSMIDYLKREGDIAGTLSSHEEALKNYREADVDEKPVNEKRRINISGTSNGLEALYGEHPEANGSSAARDWHESMKKHKFTMPASEVGEGIYWSQQINNKGEKVYVLYDTNFKDASRRDGHMIYTITVPFESPTQLEDVKQDLISIRNEAITKGGVKDGKINKDVFKREGFLGTNAKDNVYIGNPQTEDASTSGTETTGASQEGTPKEKSTGPVAQSPERQKTVAELIAEAKQNKNVTVSGERYFNQSEAQREADEKTRKENERIANQGKTKEQIEQDKKDQKRREGAANYQSRQQAGKNKNKKRNRKKQEGGEIDPFVPQYGDISYGAYNLPKYGLGSDYSVNYAYGGDVYEDAGQVDNCRCPEFNCDCPPGYTPKMGRQKMAADLERQNAFETMRPYYEDLFGYVNRGTRRDATVSPFRALVGTIGATLKHPEVWFRKRHDIPDELAYSNENPYGQEGYTYPLLGRMQSWYPNQYILPKERNERPSDNNGGGRLNRIQNKENRKIRKGIKRQGDCWGENCYENAELNMGEDGGSYPWNGTWNGNQGFQDGGFYNPFQPMNPLGRFVYAEGGMTPEEAMMMEQQAAGQEQQMPDQQMQQAPEMSQEQMQQVVEVVIGMMQQQMPPEQIIQNLVQQGVPQELAQQAVEMVMQQIQGAQQQAPAPQQQMPSPQQVPMGMYGGGMYARGGMVGQEMEVTEEQLADFKRRGIKFEIL